MGRRLFFLLLICFSINLQAEQYIPIEVSKEEVVQDIEEVNQAARVALNYLIKNKSELKFYLSGRDFKLLQSAVKNNRVHSLLSQLKGPRFLISDQRGEKDLYFFNHPIQGVIDLGYSILESQRRDNLFRNYEDLFNSIPKKYTKAFLHPKRLIKAQYKVIVKELAKLDSFFIKYLDEILDERNETEPPRRHNPMRVSSSSETGQRQTSSSDHDDSSAQCAPVDYHAKGIVNQTALAINRQLTSIKNQSNRGTCVAFAYASTAESEKIRNGYSSSNFSEQSLYAFAKVATGGKNKKDGLLTVKTAKKLKKKRYKFTYEYSWIYNKSLYREDFSNKVYPKSCDNYPFYCSTRSSQAVKRGRTWTYIGASSGPYVNSYSSLKARRKRTTMNRLIALNRPAVIGIQTDRLFRNSVAETDGYIRLDRNYGDSKKGGHAMMYVGYVRNQDLPRGVRPANGGGYVVVKNSWGVNRHDCGFYYLDHDYVKDRITSLVTINI